VPLEFHLPILLQLLKNNVDVSFQQRLIGAFLGNREENNNIKLKYARTRNVMFVGRIRSGKSTAFKVMRNPFNFVGQTSLFADTKQPVLYSFTVDTIRDMTLEEAKAAGVSEDEILKAQKIEKTQSDDSSELQKYKVSINYNINILDTPGLFERKEKGGDKERDDKELKNIISKCVELEVTKIHMIFFVCSFEGGIGAEDVQAMLQFMQLFEGAENKMALLITRSETYSFTDQEELKKQIRKTKELEEVLNKVGERIFFSGAMQKVHYDRGATSTVVDNLNNILLMRTKMYNYLFDDDTSCHVNEIKFSVDQRVLAEKLLEEAKQLSLALENSTMEKESLKEGKAILEKKAHELHSLRNFLDNQMGLKTQADELLAKGAWK